MDKWPENKGNPVSALAVWYEMLKAMRTKMQEDGCDADDITDVTWALREIEMDRRQKKRAAYVTRYRPIRTLDGLDPYPPRAAIREAARSLCALSLALRYNTGGSSWSHPRRAPLG